MAVRLFVGNLSYSTSEADLRAYFGTVAAPSQVVLPVDRETGRPRGFAFVEFLERPDAEQAIQNIATDPSYFYDVPNPTSLTGIFQRIAADIAGGSSRIVQ